MKTKLTYFQALIHIGILLIVLCSTASYSQNNTSNTKLFDDDNLIRITLRSDFDYILSYREDDREDRSAILSYEDVDGPREVQLELGSRGNFRRDSANCDFPPLKLSFKKKEIKNTIFEGQETIKLVSHCRSGYPEFIQYIFREYQVYKLYNLVTNYSFSVKMALVTYEDTGNNMPVFSQYAFLIEDNDAIAKRFRLDKIDEKVLIKDLEPHNALSLAVFEFMIGNTDWIIPFEKNVEIIGYGSKVIAVPYDFDYSGSVNIDYAKYGSSYPLISLPREYKGLCYDKETFEFVFQEYIRLRKPMMKSIRKSSYLDQVSKDHLTQYYQEFFEIIRSEEGRKMFFYNACKD